MASFKNGKIKFGFLETASSGGTLTLTSSSVSHQVITGTLAHTVQLPDATTMGNDLAHTIINASTGVVTVKLNDGSTTLITLAAGQGAQLFLTDNSTSNGTWITKIGGASASPGLGASVNGSVVTTGNRGLFSGNAVGPSTQIDYVIISTLGSTSNFGSLTVARGTSGAFASSVRGVFSGGDTSNNAGSTPSSVIDYVIMANLSNAINFGNLTIGRNFTGGCSNATIGLTCGSYSGATYPSSCDQVTIATAANATNFGNFLFGASGLAGCASTTRGLFGMGASGSGTQIGYYTFASASTATTFGTLAVSRSNGAGASNATRGLFAGGNTGSNFANIDFVTIATTGNATNFGNLTLARTGFGGCASQSYAVFAGGNPGPVNTMDYVTIATLGDAAAFGSLSTTKVNIAGCSNAHGGL